MATRCQNCERTLGWLPRPVWSPTWQCGCGVTSYHVFPSFLEVWARLAILLGLAGGAVACFVLESRGVIPRATAGRLTLFGLGLAAILAMGLLAIFIPLAILVAHAVGVPCFLGEKIRAVATMIALIGCGVLLGWIMLRSIHEETVSPESGPRDGAISATLRK